MLKRWNDVMVPQKVNRTELYFLTKKSGVLDSKLQ